MMFEIEDYFIAPDSIISKENSTQEAYLRLTQLEEAGLENTNQYEDGLLTD
jgi:hypothetical protein